MINSPLLSIILPVYNVKQFLEDCLDSILVQEYSNYEILLIDDGSTDGSTEICNNYSKLNEKIKFIRQENKGVGAARNNGIKNAKGKYIYFLDSDDFIVANFFNEIIPLLKDEIEILHFGFNRINIDKNLLNQQIPKIDFIQNLPQEKDKLAKLLNSGASLCLWNKIIKTTLIKENKIWFDGKKRGQDIAFNIKIFQITNKIMIIDKSLINYRIIMGTGKKEDPFIVTNHLDNFLSIFNFFKSDNSLEVKKYLQNLFCNWFLFVIPLNISTYRKKCRNEQTAILFNNNFIISHLNEYKPKFNFYQKCMAFSILTNQKWLFYLLGRATSMYRKIKYT